MLFNLEVNIGQLNKDIKRIDNILSSISQNYKGNRANLSKLAPLLIERPAEFRTTPGLLRPKVDVLLSKNPKMKNSLASY